MLNLTSTSDGTRQIFQEDTQLYLDAWKDLPKWKYRASRALLDSHHLFMDPFSSNRVLPFKALLDHTGCACVQRLFFCGYYRIDESFLEGDNNETETMTFKPADGVLNDFSVDDNTDWKTLRDTLTNNVIDGSLRMQRKISEHRKSIVRDQINHKSSNEREIKPDVDHKKYLIVGLAQRNVRRRWSNIQLSLDMCRTKYGSLQITCVEVNVEVDESNAVTQAAVHGGLDMLIGIHGAQLTEAIWMKSGAIVVELLPYVQHDVYGRWVNTVDQETPLGIIFKETDLNHAGYPLGGESLPEGLCSGNQAEDSGPECFNRQENTWSNRDFTVDPGIVDQAINSFLITKDADAPSLLDSKAECGDLESRAVNFTLYNIHCDGRVHHIYRKHWPEQDALCRKYPFSWCPKVPKTP